MNCSRSLYPHVGHGHMPQSLLGLRLPFQSQNAWCLRAIRCHAPPRINATQKSEASRRQSILGICSFVSWTTVAQGSAEAVQIGEVQAMSVKSAWRTSIPSILKPFQDSPCNADAYRKAGAIKRVVKLFMQEEYSKLEAITSPDAFVYFQGPASLPYVGKYTGRDCVRQFMSRFNESFIITAVPEIYQYINESGSVFTAFDFALKAVGNGKEYQTSMTMKFKVNDDLQLTKVAIISDTLAQYETLQG